MRVTVVGPTPVLKREEDGTYGRQYEPGETFDLAADRAHRLIELGYVEEAKANTTATKKDGGDS